MVAPNLSTSYAACTFSVREIVRLEHTAALTSLQTKLTTKNSSTVLSPTSTIGSKQREASMELCLWQKTGKSCVSVLYSQVAKVEQLKKVAEEAGVGTLAGYKAV